jgi:curli biogenesis system outer membrane secretion channel CsgG
MSDDPTAQAGGKELPDLAARLASSTTVSLNKNGGAVFSPSESRHSGPHERSRNKEIPMHAFAKKIAAILALGFIFALSPLPAASDGLRYTVAVAEFENKSGWNGQVRLGGAWATIMTDLLNRSGHFTVLAESSMRAAALDEQDLGASGRVAGGNKTPAVGHLTPAQILLKGVITHVQTTGSQKGGFGIGKVRVGGKRKKAEINATIYLLDTTTGQVMSSTSVVGHSESKGGMFSYRDRNNDAAFAGQKDQNLQKAMFGAVNKAIGWLVKKLPDIPWSGTVVMVRDDKVYVNRGSREGVSTGQLFLVGKRDILRDPDTGEVLDESMEEVAHLEAIRVNEKVSVCKVVSGDLRAVRKGHGVHLP